jgi:hypothetical protein
VCKRLKATYLLVRPRITTFELHNSLRTGPRSVVFRKEGEAWRIMHLHASNVPWPDEPKWAACNEGVVGRGCVLALLASPTIGTSNRLLCWVRSMETLQ